MDLLAPLLDDRGDAVVEFEQQVAIALRCRGVGRHVDAARLHHDRIDQAVHALDVLGAGERRLVGAGHLGLVTGVNHRDPGQRDGGDCKQRENDVKLGGNRQFRQHVTPRPVSPPNWL